MIQDWVFSIARSISISHGPKKASAKNEPSIDTDNYYMISDKYCIISDSLGVLFKNQREKMWRGSLESLPYACGFILSRFYLWVDHIDDHIVTVVRNQIRTPNWNVSDRIFQPHLQGGSNKNVHMPASFHPRMTLIHRFLTK